mmetsp:Transcript_2925/g.7973  ORF Transcript_2925/g.7973 Transcript_2925/m.7973 type:complete len:275 (+) Transcript_2925:295-1119(+)
MSRYETCNVITCDAAFSAAECWIQHLHKLVVRWFPQKLFHPAVSHERRIQRAKVVRGDDDWNARQATTRLDLVPTLSQANAPRVVTKSHERCGCVLVVHGAVCELEASESSIYVVDHEARCNTSVHDGPCGSAIAVAYSFCGDPSNAVLHLACRHDNRLDTHASERELDIERLAHSLVSPNAEYERNSICRCRRRRKEVAGHVYGNSLRKSLRRQEPRRVKMFESRSRRPPQFPRHEVAVDAQRISCEERVSDTRLLRLHELREVERRIGKTTR